MWEQRLVRNETVRYRKAFVPTDIRNFSHVAIIRAAVDEISIVSHLYFYAQFEAPRDRTILAHRRIRCTYGAEVTYPPFFLERSSPHQSV